MGGGAVCFSMGTFVNKGCYTIMPARSERGCYTFMSKSESTDEDECICDVVPQPRVAWQYLKALEPKQESKAATVTPTNLGSPAALDPVIVRRRKINSSAEFSSIMTAGQPVILEGLNLGACTELWKDEYLLQKVGRDRSVRMRLCCSLTLPF